MSQTMTELRSNPVLRTVTIDGQGMHVLMCRACSKEFTRPIMRGVKPFECDPCGGSPVRPKRDNGGSKDAVTETKSDEIPRHYAWGTLMSFLKASTPDVPIQPYLFGEAGTGKTYTSGLAAAELGMEFRTESCSVGGTEVDFFGFTDANGAYHRTAFRDVWENGGMFLCDELDKASPYVLSKLNAAFASKAGQSVEFPDGPVKRHPDCIIIGAGNTDMRGGTERFHTSQPIDAATMTRFAFIEWGFDHDFEFTLVAPKHRQWVKRVHSVRKAVNDTANHGANVNVSPRAILMGASMRDAGIPQNVIEDAVLWQGVNVDTRRTIESAAR